MGLTRQDLVQTFHLGISRENKQISSLFFRKVFKYYDYLQKTCKTATATNTHEISKFSRLYFRIALNRFGPREHLWSSTGFGALRMIYRFIGALFLYILPPTHISDGLVGHRENMLITVTLGLESKASGQSLKCSLYTLSRSTNNLKQHFKIRRILIANSFSYPERKFEKVAGRCGYEQIALSILYVGSTRVIYLQVPCQLQTTDF